MDPAAGGPRTPREALPRFLAHGSPRILLAAFLAAVGARLALGGFGGRDLLPPLLIGTLWPVQEWLIHVFILHARPRRVLGRSFDPLVPRMHRAHHREPWSEEWVWIPLPSFLYSLPILVALCFLLTPDARLACTALASYLALALHYEWIHYLIHTPVRPRSRHYRKVWRHHRLHHFKNEHYWYGVTMRSGDRLLRTDPDPASVAVSPTARALASEPG